MKISTRNFLTEGASISANTMYLQNVNPQLEPFIGSPCQFVMNGYVAFDLGKPEMVSCIALCGIQSYSYTEPVAGFNASWELRNGGSGGTIVASDTITEATYHDFHTHYVRFIDEVEADYFKLTFGAPTLPQYTASRIWVANSINLPHENGFVYKCSNDAVIETLRTGEDFVLPRRYRSEAVFQYFDVFDNLETADAPINGDFESLFNALVLNGTMREVVLDASFAKFHGKLTSFPTIVKSAADQYQFQFSVKEF